MENLDCAQILTQTKVASLVVVGLKLRPLHYAIDLICGALSRIEDLQLKLPTLLFKKLSDALRSTNIIGWRSIVPTIKGYIGGFPMDSMLGAAGTASSFRRFELSYRAGSMSRSLSSP